MTGTAVRRARFALFASISLALLLGTALLAHAALFGGFSDYDDEGYMILALRAWREGYPLYDRIPTIYGPFYFQLVAALSAVLRLPLDNAGARWFALGAWIAASLLCGAWAWRAHRSFLAALLAWALAFRTLTLLTKEPLHPGSLIVVLLAIAAHVALGLAKAKPKLRTWVLLGCLAAAIGLSKTNVGVFFVLAVAGAWARYAGGGRGIAFARAAVACMLPVFPFVLMRALLDAPWARDFAILVSASLVPFAVLLLLRPGESPWRWPPLLAFLAGGAALTIASVAILFAQGTTPDGLWRELVIAAVKFPAQTWREPELPPPWSVFAALALVPVGLLLRATAGAGFAAFRGAAASYVLARCALRSMPMATLPFLWILAMPPARGEGSVRERPAFLLAITVVLQSLHAFPVAGSQVAFFAFLIPLVAIHGFADAWRDLPQSWRERVPAWTRRESVALAAAAAVVVVTAFYPGWKLVPDRWREYREVEVDVGLPGTERMRLPEKRATAYAWAAANVRQSADVFLGFPGRHSLHLWSGVPSPVPFYPAAWPLFYGEEEQRALADALLAHARPCIVRTPYALDAWKKTRGLVDHAIARTIDERFRVAGEAFGIEILLLKEDTSELVMTARRVESTEPGVALRLTLPAESDAASIARVSLVDADSGRVACEPAIVSREGRAVVARCPTIEWSDRDEAYLVRASAADGTVVARLPVVR